MKRPAGATLAVLLVLGGCADRGLASGPSDSPTTGTWIIVTLAAAAAAGVLAALIVLPALRPGGSVFASGVLALQAGGVVVAGAVVVGAAVRSDQLLGRPADAEQAASLLRLSGLDGGDSGFFNLVVVVTVVLGGLLVTALVLAARFAADADPLERVLAAGLLALEAVASVVCGVLVALGFRHAGFVLPALALPVLLLATAAAWPRDGSAEPPRPSGARTA